MKYKVIDPKGIHAGGKHIAKGEVVTLPDGASLKAFLHFKQVTPHEEKKPAADPAAQAKAEAEAKAKAEADAKAKAEAEAPKK